MNLRQKSIVAATSAALAMTGGIAVAGDAAALASGSAGSSADRDREGACTSAARYDFEADRERGHYEVSFEVDSDVSGQHWRLTLWHDGKRAYQDVKVTDGEGEADFERNRPNTAGSDTFKVKATHLATGKGCLVRLVRA